MVENSKKSKLRDYDAYIADMTQYAKKYADEIFEDTELWNIRFLWSYAKQRNINLFGLKPVKKDRRKICNRMMAKVIHDAKISYSKAISSGGCGAVCPTQSP